MDNTQKPPVVLSFCPGILGIERAIKRVIGKLSVAAYVEIEAVIIANLVAGMEAGVLDPAPIWTNLKTFDARPFRNKVHGIIGGYPCFPKGSMVLTKDGYKPIEDVTTSDYVLTHKGRWRRVTHTSNNGVAEIRKIKAQGVSVETTDEHPFLSRKQGYIWNNDFRKYERVFSKQDWIESKQLSKDHFLSQILPSETDSEFSKEFWWVIGRYLADGWSQWSPSRRHKNGGRITICCNHDEADELGRRIKCAGFNAYRSKEKTATRFAITQHWLYEFVQQFGNGATGKTINQTILELPVDKARGFMDGYFSGDGYKYKSHGKYDVLKAHACSYSLALGISLLAQKTHGVVATISEINRQPKHNIEGRVVNQNPGWEISIPRRNRSAFIERGYGWKKVRSNVSVGAAEVFNLTVEEDRSYVVNGAIVHNCPGESRAGLRQGHLYEGFLWPNIRRAIKTGKPLWCFFENVEDHLQGTYPIVQRSLWNMGYSVEAGIFSAEEIGAPHSRKRVFILAVANSYLHDAHRVFRDFPKTSYPFEGKTREQNWKWLRNELGYSNTEVANPCSPGSQGMQQGLARGERSGISGSTPQRGQASAAEVGHSQSRRQWNDCLLPGQPQREAGGSGDGLVYSYQRPSFTNFPLGQGPYQWDWEEPRAIEPGLGNAINGYNFRGDLVRAIGNSVAEDSCELAWNELWKKILMI